MRRAIAGDLRPRTVRFVAGGTALVVLLAVGAACSPASKYSTPTTSEVLVATTASSLDPPTVPLHNPGDPVDPSGGRPRNGISQEDQILAAVHDVWTGEAGTLTFNNSGSVTVSIHDCPPVPGGPRFGYTTDCAPTTATGHFGLGDFDLTVAGDNGTAVDLNIYIDGNGRLHAGKGKVFLLPVTDPFFRPAEAPSVSVDMTLKQCTPDPVGGPAPPDPCTWSPPGGDTAVTIAGTTYVFDPTVRAVTTPSVFYGVLSRPNAGTPGTKPTS